MMKKERATAPFLIIDIFVNCNKFQFIVLFRSFSVISSGAKRSREIRCKRADFSTRLRLGRNDIRYLEMLEKLEFEDVIIA